jgi:GST-like protein
VLKGEADTLAAFPNLKRWFRAIDARPARLPARDPSGRIMSSKK